MSEDPKYYPDNGEYWMPERSMYAQYRAPIPKPCRKYHISSDVRSAAMVADLVLPILSEKRILHKVVARESLLNRQMAGRQAGKFITVYMPGNSEQRNPTIAELGEKLAQLSRESGAQPSPRIPRSRTYHHIFIEQPLDDGLFIYGGFVIDATK